METVGARERATLIARPFYYQIHYSPFETRASKSFFFSDCCSRIEIFFFKRSIDLLLESFPRAHLRKNPRQQEKNREESLNNIVPLTFHPNLSSNLCRNDSFSSSMRQNLSSENSLNHWPDYNCNLQIRVCECKLQLCICIFQIRLIIRLMIINKLGIVYGMHLWNIYKCINVYKIHMISNIYSQNIKSKRNIISKGWNVISLNFKNIV